MDKKLLRQIFLIGCNTITAVCLLINIIREPDPFLITAFSIMSVSVIMMTILLFIKHNDNKPTTENVVEETKVVSDNNNEEHNDNELLIIDNNISYFQVY